MEYTAVAEALTALPEGARATVFSDSQSLIENCRKRLDGWRQSGWGKVDPEILDAVKRIGAALAEKRLAVEWQWIRAHNGNAGNERADTLATQATREIKAALEKEAEEARKKAAAEGRGPGKR